MLVLRVNLWRQVVDSAKATKLTSFLVVKLMEFLANQQSEDIYNIWWLWSPIFNDAIKQQKEGLDEWKLQQQPLEQTHHSNGRSIAEARKPRLNSNRPPFDLDLRE